MKVSMLTLALSTQLQLDGAATLSVVPHEILDIAVTVKHWCIQTNKAQTVLLDV